jgi:hypothetical protein
MEKINGVHALSHDQRRRIVSGCSNTNNMTQRILIFLFAMLVPAASAFAQTTVAAKEEASFKKIDFLNYTYPAGMCSTEFGMASSMRVQNGRSLTKDFYFFVSQNKVLYGDVSGDKRTDAVVHVTCGGTGGNFSNAVIYIYIQSGGREKLLATIDSAKLEADYKRYFPDGFIVGVLKNGVKLYGTHIMVDVYADGSNASPKNIATLEYHMNFTKPVMGSKPRLRPSGI